MGGFFDDDDNDEPVENATRKASRTHHQADTGTNRWQRPVCPPPTKAQSARNENRKAHASGGKSTDAVCVDERVTRLVVLGLLK